jgi:biopolymer transport protein ExbD
MRRRFHRRPEETELNITSYMNLMVILVPFLLISAVFSQITVLQLNMPQAGAVAGENDKPALQLELILRGRDLIINNAAGRPIDKLPGSAGGVDIRALSAALYQLKQRYPEHSEITLLLEADTDYETLIALMDAVRSRMVASGMATIEVPLFPDISIGDAPGFTQQVTR